MASLGGLHVAGEVAVDRVVLEQVRERLRVRQVVDPDDLQVLALGRPEGEPPDASESIDADTCRHRARTSASWEGGQGNDLAPGAPTVGRGRYPGAAARRHGGWRLSVRGGIEPTRIRLSEAQGAARLAPAAGAARRRPRAGGGAAARDRDSRSSKPARGRRDPRRLPGDRGPPGHRRDLGAGRRVSRRERRAAHPGARARRMPSSRWASCTRRIAWRRCSGCCGSRAGARPRSSAARACPRIGWRASSISRGIAESKFAELDRGTRALLVAYARGVNARIERIRDGQAAAPVAAQRRELPLEDWRPEDSLAVLELYAWGLADSLEVSLVLSDLIKRLGGFGARPFFPPRADEARRPEWLPLPLTASRSGDALSALRRAAHLGGRSLGSSAFVVGGAPHALRAPDPGRRLAPRAHLAAAAPPRPPPGRRARRRGVDASGCPDRLDRAQPAGGLGRDQRPRRHGRPLHRDAASRGCRALPRRPRLEPAGGARRGLARARGRRRDADGALDASRTAAGSAARGRARAAGALLGGRARRRRGRAAGLARGGAVARRGGAAGGARARGRARGRGGLCRFGRRGRDAGGGLDPPASAPDRSGAARRDARAGSTGRARSSSRCSRASASAAGRGWAIAADNAFAPGADGAAAEWLWRSGERAQSGRVAAAGGGPRRAARAAAGGPAPGGRRRAARPEPGRERAGAGGARRAAPARGERADRAAAGMGRALDTR